METDLVKTYQDKALKNLPHRKRLDDIYRVIEKEGLAGKNDLTYADFGCASGFITDLVTKKLDPASAYGFCHSDGIEVGRELYPNIQFGFVELTEPSDIGQYDFCTCFETLEHVGNIEIALDNLCHATREGGGTLLITVPIEIGIVGIGKFLAKTIFYNYDLDELPGDKLYFKYLMALLTYRDMSQFRDNRFGWGTHFGFDYRRIDKHLKMNRCKFRAWNKFTTRFYLISP
jgi:2-polyprenyl-3-methyl-5-hydroxy-6-metoxy-1,4-benzoquinol methylase